MEFSYPLYVTETWQTPPLLQLAIGLPALWVQLWHYSKRMIQQKLRSCLEDIGFINKYQSGFRQNKFTDDHLFRLSQSVIESFNRGEHVVAAFLDEEKLLTKFDTMDSGIKSSRLTFGIKWHADFDSDFLVGQVIQFNVNAFFPTKSAPLQGSHRVLSWVRYFSWYLSMTY